MSIADKARRAADFFTRTTSLAGEWSGDDLQQFFTVPEQVFTAEEMIAFAENRGWQDHFPDLVIPAEEEALDLCAQAMGQFADEIDPNPIQLEAGDHLADAGNMVDGVEWNVGSMWARVNGHLAAIECGQNLFTWVVFQEGEPGVTARSNPVTPPHTLEEARRQAVESARGMG